MLAEYLLQYLISYALLHNVDRRCATTLSPWHPLYSFPKKGSSAKGPTETFVCEECGMEHIKWVGRCSGCNEWNTVKPFRVPSQQSARNLVIDKRSNVKGWVPSQSGNQNINSIVEMSAVNISVVSSRLKSWSQEFDRVVGGGLVKGSVVLLAGEPGVGKSTLLLQLVTSLRKDETDTLVYVSGEETAEQIVTRAQRLKLKYDGVYVMCEVDADIVGASTAYGHSSLT